MINNDQELQVMLERIAHFQEQLAYLRQMESNPANYHAASSGFLAEIDRMQLEVREYLSLHPTELTTASPSRLEPTCAFSLGFEPLVAPHRAEPTSPESAQGGGAGRRCRRG
jgi:hypothetical protein